MELDEINPEYIHKFYPPTEYSLDALLNHYFWFSQRESLNDPFELGHFRKGRNVLSLQKVLLEQMTSTLGPDVSIEELQKNLPKYASCSFTKSPLNKQMWAYYANDYSGWCLSFERGELKTNNSSPLLPAIYVDDNTNPINSITTQYGNTPLADAIRKVLCTKHESWQYEDEERIIIKMKNVGDGDKRVWNTYMLKEITVGNKISPTYLSLIKKYVQMKKKNGQDIKLYKIKLSDRDFKLSRELILT